MKRILIRVKTPLLLLFAIISMSVITQVRMEQLIGTLPVSKGGTGLTSSGAANNVPISNGSGWVSTAIGATNLRAKTGTAVSVTTSETQIDSIQFQPSSVNAIVIIEVSVAFTKDAGTTVRTASIRVKNNSAVQIGKDGQGTSANVAANPFGCSPVIASEAPGSTSLQTYRLYGQAGGATMNTLNYSWRIYEATPGGPKGDTGPTGATGTTGGFVPVSFQTLTDASTISWNMATSYNATVTITASRTLGTPSNLSNGAYGTLIVKQNGTGGWDLTPPANSKMIGNTFRSGKFPIDSTANAINILGYTYDGTNLYWTCGRTYN